MLEFLQAYGWWILLGGAFLFMMSRGGGCGMGHSDTQSGDHEDQSRETLYRSGTGQAKLDDTTAAKPRAASHSGGCH